MQGFLRSPYVIIQSIQSFDSGQKGRRKYKSIPDEGYWLFSRSGFLTSAGRTAGTLSIGGWLEYRGGFDAVEKRKDSCPIQQFNHCSSAVRSII